MIRAKVKLRRETVKRVAELEGPTKVEVGFPSGSIGGKRPVDAAVIAVAMFNEFGTRTIPERPFIRNTIRSHRDEYIEAMAEGAAAVVRGESDIEDALSKLGLKAAGDIQRAMPGTPPPNKPSTVAKKGSSKTLIDTGRLRQSITWKVED